MIHGFVIAIGVSLMIICFIMACIRFYELYTGPDWKSALDDLREGACQIKRILLRIVRIERCH